ncbi:MAG: RIP metalloprotease RseP, partial [Candidatus Moraniibacteriota bacterium]
WVRGSKAVISKNTVYSLNWFPIGGFVKIKGEDGDGKKEQDSFSSKPAWARVLVLAAGVLMNFFFAWLLLSATFMLGSYQDVTNQKVNGAKVLVQSVEENSPAQKMGLQAGDILLGNETEKFATVENMQAYVNANKGSEILLKVQRGKSEIQLAGTPRQQVSEGQGALGISSLSEVVMKRFSFFEALQEGWFEIGAIILLMLETFGRLFSGNRAGLTVTGVVGIASYTGQIIPLGFSFLLRFMAILSINLGVVNALPFPALDGGRILFILIEKIKGSAVRQEVEQFFHTAGFFILISLMIVVTYFDLVRMDIFGKIRGLF